MSSGAALLLLFSWPGTAPEAVLGGKAALVVVAPTGIAPAALEEIRRSISTRWRLLDASEIRRALESPTEAPSEEEEVRLELVAAKERLRRFDLPGVERALVRARAKACGLSPKASARDLALELALREAGLAQLRDGEENAIRALRFALAIEPNLELDRDTHAPTLIALLGAARRQLERANEIEIEIETLPPGALVYIGGASVGTTPLRVSSAEGPQVVWVQAAGFSPKVAWVDVSSGFKISMELHPSPPEDELVPLVAAVTRTSGAQRDAAARMLAVALEIDAVFLVESASAAARRIDRVRLEPVTAPLVVPETAAVRWPAYVTGAGAALLTGVGVAFGFAARQSDRRSQDAAFADDGLRLHDSAVRSAVVANTLFVLGAASAIGAVALFVIE